MWTLAVLLPFFLLLWLFRLYRDCAGTTLLRRDRVTGPGGRWLGYEVRRRVSMVTVPRYVSEFPVPRETRMLVLCFAGVPLWHKALSIALPEPACGHLDQVSPLAFDSRFPGWLQVGSPPAGGRAHVVAW